MNDASAGRLLQADERRLHEARRLVASERRYRQLVESSPLGVVEVSAAGELVYVSPQVEAWSGLTAHAAPAMALQLVHPGDRTAVARLGVPRVSATGALEVRWRRDRRRDWRWTRLRWGPAAAAPGQPAGLLIVAEDTTKHRRQQMLAAAGGRVREAVWGLSHRQ